ncbi:MAG: tRNA preQ1(34) S-adenosylmethionine ribosyltransferase-isomerase QueA [Chloroflexi bacterium]|nr:tRNA preQ1(34) S-adenosylmethionine ribosyltransferase-isomerase QueA [Chloroflexota bacterium]
MKTAEFDYELPPEMIAQTPIEPRDSSRLLVLERHSGEIAHAHFRDIGEYLRSGDLLVANDSRVIPARLRGRKASGGGVEVFLLQQLAERTWEALVRGKRLRSGARIEIQNPKRNVPITDHASRITSLWATIVAEPPDGGRIIEFDRPIEPLLDELGLVPLPPYIHEPLADPERYQTVYARVQGSVAAPTAGLHFTPVLIDRLQAQGVRFAFVTLHVGLDTFRPVKTEHIEEHPMHSEWAELPPETAEAIHQTRTQGGRVVAVGTTAVRVLETAASLPETNLEPETWNLKPFRTWTDLFITPGYHFRLVDAMITNFHLPRSTLLMLVAAFAGKPLVDRVYREAIAGGYRFYSFGDAMLIL